MFKQAMIIQAQSLSFIVAETRKKTSDTHQTIHLRLFFQRLKAVFFIQKGQYRQAQSNI